MTNMKILNGLRDVKILEGGFLSPKGFRIEDFYGDFMLKTARPMATVVIPNTNSFAAKYLLKCEVRAYKRQIERLIIGFDAVGLSRQYKGRTEEKVRLFTKGSRIKEEETLILPLPYADEEKKEALLSGKEGYAFSFSLGDDYPCTIGGMVFGSAKVVEAPRVALLTTDVKITKELLKSALQSVVKDTFLMMHGGNGANDCFYAVSSCAAENAVIVVKDVEYDKFLKALRFVADELAKLMAFEGGAKPLKFCVRGATSKQAAKSIVKNALDRGSVARLNGKKLALAVFEALGSTGMTFYKERLSAYLSSSSGRLQFLEEGYPLPISEERLAELLSEETVEIVTELGLGNFSASGWTCVCKNF